VICIILCTVTELQQELVDAREMRDVKLTEIERRVEDEAATQQAAFDKKVGDG